MADDGGAPAPDGGAPVPGGSNARGNNVPDSTGHVENYRVPNVPTFYKNDPALWFLHSEGNNVRGHHGRHSPRGGGL